jgi:hypothetical protein
MQVSGPVKEDTVTVPKIAAVERREACVPVTRRAAPQGADEERSAFWRSAPLAHARERERKAPPRASPTKGTTALALMAAPDAACERGLFDDARERGLFDNRI